MKTQIMVALSSVEYGQNKCHICFSCTCSLDHYKNYYLDFCGTELYTNIPLSEGKLDHLKQMLLDDYGYAPFDIVKVKQILNSKFQYCITF